MHILHSIFVRAFRYLAENGWVGSARLWWAHLLGIFVWGHFAAAQQSWQPVAMHGGGYVTGLVLHPTNANTVFARTDVAGVYKSTNKGGHWQSLTASLPKDDPYLFQVRSLVVHPTDSQQLFMVSGNAPYSDARVFWKTTDGGTTWQRAAVPTNITGNQLARSAGETMAFFPDQLDSLLVAGQPTYNWSTNNWNSNGGLYAYHPASNGWTRLDADGAFGQTWFCAVRFHPTNSNVIYLAALTHQQWGAATPHAGLWRYERDSRLFTQLLAAPVFDFDFDAQQPNTIVTTAADGIRVSTDGGASWSAVVKPFGYNYDFFVKTHPQQSGHWYWGYWSSFGTNGLVETTDGGATFRDVKYHTGTNRQQIFYPSYAAVNYRPSFGNAPSALVFSEQQQGLAYISDWYGVWRSTDALPPLANGAASATENATWSWTWATKGIYNVVQLRASSHPVDARRFYSSLADIGFYTSASASDVPRHQSSFPVTSTYKVAFAPSDTAIGYCVGKHHTSKGRLVRTTDGGKTWHDPATGSQYAPTYFEIGNSSAVTDVQIADGNAAQLVVGIEKGSMTNQVSRSMDGGLTFTGWDDGLQKTNIFKTWTKVDKLLKAADGATFFIWHENHLYKRHWNASAWQLCTNPTGTGWFSQVACHPSQPSVVYATQYGGALFKSTDGGQTWGTLPTPASRSTLFSVSAQNQIALLDGENVSSGKVQQVYFSSDDGASWSAIGTSGLLAPVSGLLLLPDCQTIVAWTGSTGAATYTLTATQLPVELHFFKADCSTNRLVWQTVFEENNHFFEIQHSTDGIAFHSVDTVQGNGTITHPFDYQWQITVPAAGYYRLKQVDYNGSSSYSDIIFVNCPSYATENDCKSFVVFHDAGILLKNASKIERYAFVAADGRTILQHSLQTPLSEYFLRFEDVSVSQGWLRLFLSDGSHCSFYVVRP